eukprot:Skav221164  [mRNA]  locus=scaffold85:232230:237366:- [translate_table: standard]
MNHHWPSWIHHLAETAQPSLDSEAVHGPCASAKGHARSRRRILGSAAIVKVLEITRADPRPGEGPWVHPAVAPADPCPTKVCFASRSVDNMFSFVDHGSTGEQHGESSLRLAPVTQQLHWISEVSFEGHGGSRYRSKMPNHGRCPERPVAGLSRARPHA